MKGFVFTLDAMLAIIVSILLLTAIYAMMPLSQRDYFTDSYLAKVSNDALVVLDKRDVLETHDTALIKSTLSNILPTNLDARLNVYVYECGTVECTNFILSEQVKPYVVEVDRPNSMEEDAVLAKRSFITFDHNSVKYFCIAELRVWLA